MTKNGLFRPKFDDFSKIHTKCMHNFLTFDLPDQKTLYDGTLYILFIYGDTCRLGTSVDPWTFISGPKKSKISIFGQNRQLKVHNMNFECIGPTLLVNSISLVAFLLISVHLRSSLDL